MRARYYAALAAFFIAVFGIVGLLVSADSACEDIVFEEEILYGDPSAAKGLEIAFSSGMEQHLLWNHKLRFDEQGLAGSETLFHYYPVGIPSENGRVIDDGSISSEQALDACLRNSKLYIYSNADSDDLLTLIKDHVPKTDGTHTFNILLSELTDVYPLEFDFDFPGFYLSSAFYGKQDPACEELFRRLKEYFRIPVLEDECLSGDISQRNGQINYISWFDRLTHNDIYYPNAVSTLTEDACYFTLNLFSEKGNLMDFSQIPGGFGIYRLPYSLKENKDGYTAEQLDGGSLSVFYPLDAEEQVLWLGTSRARTHLLMLSQKDGAYRFSVIRLSDAALTQSFLLSENPDDFYYSFMSSPDGVLLQDREGLRLFWEYEDGSFEESLRIPLPELDAYDAENPEALVWCHGTYSFTFDGERLAVAAPERTVYNETGGSYTGPGLVLAVYDASGLIYASRCTSGLNQCNTSDTEYCYPIRPYFPAYQTYALLNWD